MPAYLFCFHTDSLHGLFLTTDILKKMNVASPSCTKLHGARILYCCYYCTFIYISSRIFESQFIVTV